MKLWVTNSGLCRTNLELTEALETVLVYRDQESDLFFTKKREVHFLNLVKDQIKLHSKEINLIVSTIYLRIYITMTFILRHTLVLIRRIPSIANEGFMRGRQLQRPARPQNRLCTSRQFAFITCRKFIALYILSVSLTTADACQAVTKSEDLLS